MRKLEEEINEMSCRNDKERKKGRKEERRQKERKEERRRGGKKEETQKDREIE